MKDLLRYLKSLVKSKKKAPPASVSPDLSHVSGCINFFWDSKSGDFNVILDVDEETSTSAEVLGMLMCYISEGHMADFLAESLRHWCDSPEKMEFYTNVLKMWNVMRELQEEERKREENRPLISPSDVFRFKGNENAN
jgi:hypothetical protein